MYTILIEINFAIYATIISHTHMESLEQTLCHNNQADVKTRSTATRRQGKLYHHNKQNQILLFASHLQVKDTIGLGFFPFKRGCPLFTGYRMYSVLCPLFGVSFIRGFTVRLFHCNLDSIHGRGYRG